VGGKKNVAHPRIRLFGGVREGKKSMSRNVLWEPKLSIREGNPLTTTGKSARKVHRDRKLVKILKSSWGKRACRGGSPPTGTFSDGTFFAMGGEEREQRHG